MRKMKFDKNYFNGKNSGYTGGYGKAAELMNKRLRKILKYKQSGKLLDVGCAFGFFLQDSDKYFETYGFDISKYAINKAKEITKAKLHVNSADNNWKYNDNFFDVITIFDCIEHTKSPNKVIREARRTIKEHGYIYIDTPNKFMRNLIGDKDLTHVNKHNIPYGIKLFHKNGLIVTEQNTEFPRFVGCKDWINSILKIYKLPLGTNICFILTKPKT